MNKGSEVGTQRPPPHGLPLDQIRLSQLSRASSRSPLRTQSTDHRPQAALKTQQAGAMRHNICVGPVIFHANTHTQKKITFDIEFGVDRLYMLSDMRTS